MSEPGVDLPETIVELRDLSFAYPQTPVLEDVNFTIARGDYVCMVGPNGGGKTTLLRLILGLLTPTRGTVRVFGQTPVEARQRIPALANARDFAKPGLHR